MDIEQRIIRVLSGTGNAADEQAVADFRKENPEEYALIAKVWFEAQPQFQSFDSKEAWVKVQPQVVRPRPVIKRWALASAVVGIAATVLFVILITGLFDQNPPGNWITVTNEDAVQQQVVLPDESEVFLAPGATVSYPPTFSEAQRNIQFKGKGYFDIEKRPEQPFVVRMLNAEVKVLGTSFQIEDNERQTHVAVTSGKVQLSQRFTEEFVYLEKGESGRIQNEEIAKFMTRQKNFDAWHTGYFSFNQAPLDSILLALNTYYGPVFQSDLSSSKPCRLNIQTQAQKPEEIAEIIQLICGLSFSQDNRTITFRK